MPGVQIEAKAQPGLNTLLYHLPSEPAATATEVEHCIKICLRYLVDRIAIGIIKGGLSRRADELTHFEGRNGQMIGVHVSGSAATTGTRRYASRWRVSRLATAWCL
jgi:hypothetical protein